MLKALNNPKQEDADGHAVVKTMSRMSISSHLSTQSLAVNYEEVKPEKAQPRHPGRCQVASLLWMDEIHFAPLANHGNPLFIGIYRGIIIPGLLGWCEMDFVHQQ